MSRPMRCPECGSLAIDIAPRDMSGGWPFNVDPERLVWSHQDYLSALCPVMTSSGYQPALPTR